MASAICLFDAPSILDCEVTPIPGSGSSPMEVVASLPHKITELVVNDGIGEYVGLYEGTVGQEELRCVIASGTVYKIDVIFQRGGRVSIKSMSPSAISSGSLCVTFVG